jgi:hypothetical protein
VNGRISLCCFTPIEIRHVCKASSSSQMHESTTWIIQQAVGLQSSHQGPSMPHHPRDGRSSTSILLIAIGVPVEASSSLTDERGKAGKPHLPASLWAIIVLEAAWAERSNASVASIGFARRPVCLNAIAEASWYVWPASKQPRTGPDYVSRLASSRNTPLAPLAARPRPWGLAPLLIYHRTKNELGSRQRFDGYHDQK